MTALLYRMTCPRCRRIARAMRLATLGAIALTPLRREEADRIADASDTKGKLLVRRGGMLLSGAPAARALLRASWPRWAMLTAFWLAVLLAVQGGGR